MTKYLTSYEMERSKVIKKLYDFVPFERVEKIADVGAGVGHFSDILSKYNRQIICLDGSAAVLEACKAKNYETLCCDFNKHLPLPDSSIDFVNALEIIEHLDSPENFLGELKRIMKVNGYLLISTINNNSPLGWKGVFDEKRLGIKWHAWDETHTHLFKYHEFIDLVSRDFKIIKTYGYFYGMLVKNRIFPPVLWRMHTSAKALSPFGFNTIVLAQKIDDSKKA